MTEALDSAVPWVAKHTRKYVESDGEDGYLWNGAPTLVLTTTGRRSGQLRRNALIYGQDGDRHIVVGSRGGDDNHPLWYLNLLDNPDVGVQVMGDKFTARARTASAEEKEKLWPLMTSIWPDYDQYQAKTERDIPVVILERT
ncbi:MAG TPA: nitroreductase family deazaflavin-dependent oxidoreductase [Acidimicrobiia bacterium]|jgi:deazaflavin-dependent oxidoreductase (nitroreductase family)